MTPTPKSWEVAMRDLVEAAGDHNITMTANTLIGLIRGTLHTKAQEIRGMKDGKYNKEDMEKLLGMINSAPFPLLALHHALYRMHELALESAAKILEC